MEYDNSSRDNGEWGEWVNGSGRRVVAGYTQTYLRRFPVRAVAANPQRMTPRSPIAPRVRVRVSVWVRVWVRVRVSSSSSSPLTSSKL